MDTRQGSHQIVYRSDASLERPALRPTENSNSCREFQRNKGTREVKGEQRTRLMRRLVVGVQRRPCQTQVRGTYLRCVVTTVALAAVGGRGGAAMIGR